MDGKYVTGGDGRGVPRILVDLAEGRLTEAEADAVVTWVTAAGLEDVPPWIVNRAVRIARQATADRASRPTLWRRLVAALVYDNRLETRPGGARAVDAGPPRLRYAAGGVEIDLELGDSGLAGRVHLLGQVDASAADLDLASVAVNGPSGHHEATIDELGQFTLDGLAHGPHRLEVRLVAELIEIPDLRL